MIEMRREKRWPAKLNLEISNLFKQDHVKVENINAPIEVIDVSKAGIGFRSASVLPMGYYFNARLTLAENDSLNCVVRIIRQQKSGDDYIYGCEIVGTASIMDYVINAPVLRRSLFCTGVFILKKIFTNPIDKGNTRWYL